MNVVEAIKNGFTLNLISLGVHVLAHLNSSFWETVFHKSESGNFKVFIVILGRGWTLTRPRVYTV